MSQDPPPDLSFGPISDVIGSPGAERHSRQLFDERWGDRSWDPLADPGNARRIRTIVEMCPIVDTLLDVGCGNGDVLLALAEKARRRCGCDASPAGIQALIQIGGGARPDGGGEDGAGGLFGVLAEADRLPFQDRSFELVTCCDVLEHLPEPAFLAAVQELMRVSARYVLVNLPLKEDLSWSHLRCGACGHVYHRDHHQRRFLRVHVEELLPAVSFRRVDSRTTGWIVRHPVTLPEGLGALLSLGHDPGARCERCGARPAPLSRPRRLLRDAFVFCHNALSRPLAGRLSRDSEIVVLFRRTEE